jgi:hypothetical protein
MSFFKFNIKINKKVRLIGKDGEVRAAIDGTESAQDVEVAKKIDGLNIYFLIGVKYLNGIAIFVALWAFLLPFPYRFVVALCALIFLFSIAAFVYSKGVIPFDEFKKSKAVHVGYAMGFSSIVLAWRVFCDFHFVNAGGILMPMGIVFLCLSIWLCLKARNFKVRARAYFIALPYLFAFSFGFVAEVNGIFDFSEPIEYDVKIISKELNDRGDGPTLYYLMVTEWLEREDNNRLIVSKKVYDNFNINDEVRIKVKQGFLNIPYYFVLKK